MKKGFIRFLGFAIGTYLFLVFGCATTTFKEGLNFLSEPAGANVIVSDSTGEIIYKGISLSSPSDIGAKINGKAPFRVEYSLEGYNSVSIEIRKEKNNWVAGISNGSRFSPIQGNWINITMKKTAETLAAEAEAKRIATEEKAEARRRMLENFIVKPSNPNFDPSQFSSVDLFRAVSVSKNLQRTSNETEAITNEALSSLMGISGKIAGIFVSDLVFVSQNGTDITFSSDDNAISQLMTIDQRSGLQVGQKVRVYYVVTRSPLLTWNIRAIERR